MNAPQLADNPAELLATLQGDYLLAAFDCDGTLAPIAASPAAAHVSTEIRHNLTLLAEHPRTRVAIISGRPLAEVMKMVGVKDCIYAGVHGLEMADGRCELPVRPAQQAAVRMLASALATRLAGEPGIIVEDKNISVAVHYRAADCAVAQRACELVRTMTAESGGLVRIVPGKKVLEVRPDVACDKGTCLMSLWQQIARETGQSWQVLYVGDDTTDEDVFRVLPAPAVTVCVGMQQTAARWRVRDCDQVAELIAALVKQRYRKTA